jgi:hypothetical protein
MDDDPARSEIIRLRGQGYSWRTIADSLNTRQVPTRSGGGQWWPSSVRTQSDPDLVRAWAGYIKAYRGRGLNT